MAARQAGNEEAREDVMDSPSRAAVRPSSEAPTLQSPRLLDEARERFRRLHNKRRTEEADVHWARAFVRFHGIRRKWAAPRWTSSSTDSLPSKASSLMHRRR